MSRSRRVQAVASAAVLVIVLVGAAVWTRSSADDGREARAAVQVPSRSEHDVAVLSVDFDPPLASNARLSRTPCLLVAVDNRGAQTEAGLIVEAKLTAGDATEVATVAQPVGTLAPGEVKVVRFTESIHAPLQQSQMVTVIVRPVTGEVNYSNNTKSLRLDGQISLTRN